MTVKKQLEYPKGTVIASKIYKAEGGKATVLKRLENDERGAMYEVQWIRSSRSGPLSETQIDGAVEIK